MINRALPVLLVSAALAVTLVACGDDTVDDGSGSSLPDDTPPATAASDGYSHPTGADEVVFEYAEVGGFVPIEIAFQQLPSLLVAGDGQAFTPGPQIAIYPAPLLPAVQVQPITEAGIQALLAAADEAGLLADVVYDEPMQIADATTARVTINVDGETYVHEAYALGFETPDQEMSPERRALSDFIAQLGDLAGVVGADELGETAIYEPAQYGIRAMAIDDLTSYGSDGIEPTVVAWPAEAGVALADASDCVVVDAATVGATFAEANQLTFFDDGGTTYQVLVKPMLAGTVCGE